MSDFSPTWLWVSFGAYLLLLVVAAKMLSRQMQGLTDFFLAGRQLSAWTIGLTFVASWFGAGSTIGTLNHTFAQGISAMWLIAIPSVLSCLVVGIFLSHQVRRLNCISQPQAIEAQYGPMGALILACIILWAITTFIASQLVAAGQLLQLTMGLAPATSVFVILAAIVIYSMLGGFRAVVMTDVIQFWSFTLGLGILLWFVLATPPVNPVPTVAATFWSPWHQWQTHLPMVFTFVLAWSIAPEMWQRMSSTRTEREARFSASMAGMILAGLFVIVMLIGLNAPRMIEAGDAFASKNVLVALAMSLPSPVLTILVLLGVLSAITSTIDSSLNVGSLTVSRDLVHRHLWPEATSAQLVQVSRWATAIIGLPAAIITLKYQSIIQILWLSADIYASAMFIPVMGLFYWPNSGRRAGILAMLFGVAPVVLNFLHDFHLIPLPAFWPGAPYTTLLGVALSATGFVLGATVWRQPHPGETPLALSLPHETVHAAPRG